MENDCINCPVESVCFYPYKPCACVHRYKFWSAEQRAERDPNFCQCIEEGKPLNNCKECPR